MVRTLALTLSFRPSITYKQLTIHSTKLQFLYTGKVAQVLIIYRSILPNAQQLSPLCTATTCAFRCDR